MTALESDFYDHAIADEASPHLLPALEGPYAELYRAIVDLLEEQPPAHVVDLGCCAGRLAALIGPNTGHTLSYVGVDFSEHMIAEAVKFNGEHVSDVGTVDAHERLDGTFAFVQHDLRHGLDFLFADEHESEGPTAHTVLAIETLEHLDNDLRLLARLPVDARLIVSVPSFDSRGHVRHFPNAGDALARYSEVLEINTWRQVWLPERTGYFHLIEGSIRP